MLPSRLCSPRRTLGPLTLRNRIIKAATFEGVTPGGQVSDELIAFHRRVAAGGAAMTTVAYLAVSPEGRTDRHCLLLSEDDAAGAAPPDRRRARRGRGRGRTDRPRRPGGQRPLQRRARPLALRRLDARWARACAPSTSPASSASPRTTGARPALAVEAGFDSIEVHVGHNYLLSAFLSPKLNRRDDQFGGTRREPRPLRPRRVLRAVRDAVGDRTWR